MAELDPEIVERAARWCAEAGRHAGAADIRAALGALSWDELLHARALLADPPPARPLGPFALADLARGAPADVAAEREREGRYRREPLEPGGDPAPGEAPTAAGAPARKLTRPKRRGPAAQVVVRRAADRAPAPPPPPPARPQLGALFEPEGRAELERLVRRHGGRRAAILAELAARWTAPEGVSDRELDALLDHHGLAHAYARRERDELLHVLRAAGGSMAAAAERVGLDRPAFAAAVARLGAEREAARIRDERREDLRRRSTLTDRVAALLSDGARLADLELLAEFEADLRARLPEHVRALRAAGEAPVAGLARTLALAPADAARLAERFGVAAAAPAARQDSPRRPPARPPRRDERRPGRPPRDDAKGGKPRPPSKPGRRPPARPGARTPARPGPRPSGKAGGRRPPPRRRG